MSEGVATVYVLFDESVHSFVSHVSHVLQYVTVRPIVILCCFLPHGDGQVPIFCFELDQIDTLACLANDLHALVLAVATLQHQQLPNGERGRLAHGGGHDSYS